MKNAMSDAKSILRDYFGYDRFREFQEEIILSLTHGNDAFVLMPTGSGKSLCYQIPAMLRQGAGIVISPLIALMQDQVDALRQTGIRADFLNSTLSAQASAAVEQRIIAGESDILYAAPERLATSGFQRLLSQSRIALFAIDEAHCISQWGHDFRPEYLQIASILRQFPGIPRIALTATADLITRKEILEKLNLTQARQFISGFDRPNISYRVEVRQNRKQQLLEFLSEHPGESGIIYCLSRKETDSIAAGLSGIGYTALPYHAGMTSESRLTHQRRFMREEGLIIVATIAFGMGIDKPDVRFVAHLGMPKTIEAYYQETGRAGRDGKKSEAWMIYSLADVVAHRRMMERSEGDETFKHIRQKKIEAMLSYCESLVCRRKILLNYLGEDYSGPCGNCDICLGKVETWEGLIVAQKALSCVYRTGQRFGSEYLMDVLLGIPNERIIRYGHDKISTFGIGMELSKKEWRSVFRQLAAAGFLTTDADDKGGFRLSPESRAVLKGEQKVFFRKDPVRSKADRKTKHYYRSENEFSDPSYIELWEKLRSLRLEFAERENVPPYVIFHDSTLRELVQIQPQTLEEMKKIYGVGQKKLERYGEQVILILQDHVRKHGIPKISSEKPLHVPKPTWLSATVLETLHLFQSGKSPEEIAEYRHLVVGTIYGHLSELISEGQVLLKDAVRLNEEEILEITDAYQLLPEDQKHRLKPVFEKFEGKYNYGIIRCVVAGLAMENEANYFRKEIICLANSRKYSGYCVAGKEITENGIAQWIRPVSIRETGEMLSREIMFNDGNIPKLLDIIAVPFEQHVPHSCQIENWLIAKKNWIRKGEFSLSDMPKLCDNPDTLWINGYHGNYGINDKIPQERAESISSSLLLIEPENFIVTVQEESGIKKVRGKFDFKGIAYKLAITDPGIENQYLAKSSGQYPIYEKPLYLTISVSEPFNDYHYKLIAGVVRGSTQLI